MIVAGLGCRPGTPTATLAALLAPYGATALASHADRRAEIGALAGALGLPLILHDSLAGIETPSRSARIEALFGTGCLAEAAALAALAPGARIILPRLVSADGRATLALAEGEPK